MKITLKKHLKYIKNKFAKNIGFLYKVKTHLNKKLLALYHSYVYTSINFANIASSSSHFAKLRRLHSEQKHTLHIIHNKDRFERTCTFQTEQNVRCLSTKYTELCSVYA